MVLGMLAIIAWFDQTSRVDEIFERAIVLELLDDTGGQGHSCAELAAVVGASEAEVERAVERLREAGILHRDGETVRASSAVLRLDDLGMISI
jgi:DNA-binding IclR family transcriptional regulator